MGRSEHKDMVYSDSDVRVEVYVSCLSLGAYRLLCSTLETFGKALLYWLIDDACSVIHLLTANNIPLQT